MATTDIQKNTVLGTGFLMVTGTLILIAAHGEIFLSLPVGAAYFTLWIIWWVIAFALGSQVLFTQEKKSRAMNIAFALMSVLATCFGATWEYTHYRQPIPRDGWLAWLGIGVILFSIFLLTSSMWVVGNFSGSFKNDSSGKCLFSKGPYHYVRHPGYLSLILFTLGSAVALSSLIAWVTFVVTIIFSLYRIHEDEKRLEKNYGEAFLRFKRNIPWVLFPGIY